MRISSWRFFSIISSSSFSIALARSSFSMPLREKILTPTMIPSMPGGHTSDASRTSPAFSPKIARSSFSSGVSCVSPFGQDLPLVDLLAHADDRLLVDARVLVRPLELRHRVDVGAHFTRHRLRFPFHADDDALAVDVVDGAGPARHDTGARVARGDVL